MSAVIEAPLFDSAENALRFALNFHLAQARPQMNKMMADGKVQRIKLADGTTVTFVAPVKPSVTLLRGLDGAGQAGLILGALATLTPERQLVLIAQCLKPAFPCSCRSACCSGWKANFDWERSISGLCEHLKADAPLSHITGKRGLSMDPGLRRVLVETFFQPRRKRTATELAAKFGLSDKTVITHSRPVVTYLERVLGEAWGDFGSLMDDRGWVGFVP